MSLSFSSTTGCAISAAVNPLSYRDVIVGEEMVESAKLPPAAAEEGSSESQVSLLPQELEQLLSVARTEAAAEAERRLRIELEARLAEETTRVRGAVDEFITQRKQYFARVEGEVLRLALAIAAKILNREAQADPMLVAAMVRVALDRLQETSSVSLRVPLAEVERWRTCMSPTPQGLAVEVIGDAQLGAKECILQSGLGTVDFSIEAQLKEVEQGFFDLLAQRPMLP